MRRNAALLEDCKRLECHNSNQSSSDRSACGRHEFPADAVKKMGEMGLMGVTQSTDYGGAGMDTMSYAIAIEELARGCAGCSVIASAHNSLYWYALWPVGLLQLLWPPKRRHNPVLAGRF